MKPHLVEARTGVAVSHLASSSLLASRWVCWTLVIQEQD